MKRLGRTWLGALALGLLELLGCQARISYEVARWNGSPYFGRCDGPRGHRGNHYLERGFDIYFFTDAGLPVGTP